MTSHQCKEMTGRLPMQMATDSESNDSTVLQFYPPRLWGLNYLFSVFIKMYIADIVDMSQHPQFSGAFYQDLVPEFVPLQIEDQGHIVLGVYSYKNHPVYKIDVMGTIVKKSENSKCFIYAVDDGTGVILCCCWKENYNKSVSVCTDSLASLPVCLQERVHEIQADASSAVQGYCLGDLVHVKGKIKVFREQKEIIATYHKRIEDPTFKVFRMLELPRLYRLALDTSFQLPQKIQVALQQQSPSTLTAAKSEARLAMDLKTIIFNYINNSDHIIDLDPNDLLKYAKVKDILREEGQLQLNSQMGMPVILQALSCMEDEGYVTRRTDRRILYEVLLHRSKLERKIQWILNEETTKPKYAMTGCHYLHIVDELHKTYQYARVKKEAVIYCLQKLEAQSDVIRTTHAHYLPCAF